MRLFVFIVLISFTNSLSASHEWTDTERDQIMYCAKKYHEYRNSQSFLISISQLLRYRFLRSDNEVVGRLISYFDAKRIKWFLKSEAIISLYRDGRTFPNSGKSYDERMGSRSSVYSNLFKLHNILITLEKNFPADDLSTIIANAHELVKRQTEKRLRLRLSRDVPHARNQKRNSLFVMPIPAA